MQLHREQESVIGGLAVTLDVRCRSLISPVFFAVKKITNADLIHKTSCRLFWIIKWKLAKNYKS